MRHFLLLFIAAAAILAVDASIVGGHRAYENQLYEDLLYDYNKIPRPVKNSSEVLMVDVGSSLIRIIDVDEKNQVLTTNLWLDMVSKMQSFALTGEYFFSSLPFQKWIDAKLRWSPQRYGGIQTLHIPSDQVRAHACIGVV